MGRKQLVGILLATMDPKQEGLVNTCFLTVRLPSWAGARQNVTGSDIEGRTISAGGRTMPTYRGLSRSLIDVDMAAFSALETQLTEFQEEVTALSQKITELEAQVAQLAARGDV